MRKPVDLHKSKSFNTIIVMRTILRGPSCNIAVINCAVQTGRPRAYIGMNKYVLVFTSWKFKVGDIEITGDCPCKKFMAHSNVKIKY